MAGISKDPAKISVELDKVKEQIKVLTEKKKELEERLQSAYDAEVAGIFRRKGIEPKEFCVALKGLDDEKMRMVLEYASSIRTDNNVPSGVLKDIEKESVTE